MIFFMKFRKFGSSFYQTHLLYAGLSGTITEDFAIRRTTYTVGLPIQYKTIFDSSFIKTADETQREYNEM